MKKCERWAMVIALPIVAMLILMDTISDAWFAFRLDWRWTWKEFKDNWRNDGY